MTVYVNDLPFAILPGMSVRHALICSGLIEKIDASKRVYDEWGNELGLDGALSAGMKIYVR